MVYRAVIFDLDGLLVNSEVLIEGTWKQALAEIGFQLAHEMFVPLVGVQTSVIGEAFRRNFGVDAVAFDQLYARRTALLADFYQNRLSPGDLKPGALPLLDLLEANAVPRAVATLTRREVVEIMLEKTCITRYFDLVVCGNEVSQPKPAPDIFLEAARRLDIPAENCIVLEDSAAGILAASRAGMLPFLVPDLLQPPPEVSSLAHAQFKTLSDATGEIARLLSI